MILFPVLSIFGTIGILVVVLLVVGAIIGFMMARKGA